MGNEVVTKALLLLSNLNVWKDNTSLIFTH